jgi:hypothetical protein
MHALGDSGGCGLEIDPPVFRKRCKGRRGEKGGSQGGHQVSHDR